MMPTFWNWLFLGAALIIVEVFAPGFVFLWLGIAAGLTGALVFLLPDLAWEMQLLAFAGLGVSSIVGWLILRRRASRAEDRSTLNRRGAHYVGRTFPLIEAIRDGRGRIRLGDSTWVVEGPDTPAGGQVRVTAVDGAVLVVEPAADAAPTGSDPNTGG